MSVSGIKQQEKVCGDNMPHVYTLYTQDVVGRREEDKELRIGSDDYVILDIGKSKICRAFSNLETLGRVTLQSSIQK